jgi:hypothetical protein
MKIRFVMIGNCPKCGKEHVRKPPVDATVCTCKNPDAVLVPLQPALVLSSREYAKLLKISKLSGVPLKDLVNAALEEAAKRKLEALNLTSQRFPQIAVTTRR